MPGNRSQEASHSLLKARISTHGAFWGREEQLSKLKLLCSQISGTHKGSTGGERSCKCQIALVHGPSGSGKTKAAKEFQKNGDNIHFLFGKFDQYSDKSMPYSALVQAFQSIFESDQEDNNGLFGAVQEALDAEARVLGELIPSLRRETKGASDEMVPESEEDGGDDSGGMKMVMGPERLAVAFVAFLRSFCKPEHPVILAIDDMQYADPDTLTVIRAIAMHSSEIDHLLLLGIYRDDSPAEMLDAFIHELKQQPDVHEIVFANFNAKQVTAFVTDILAIEYEHNNKSQSIAEFVDLIHRRTQGNPHFLLEFLRMLQRRHLLIFDWATNRWKWEISEIQAKTNVTENVVAVLTQKVQQLPPKVLRMLQVAAALGFVFELQLLELLYEMTYDHDLVATIITSILPGADQGESEDDLSFSEMIDLSVGENIIELDSRSHGIYYRFCHDKLQEALYSLIPPSEGRDLMHWYAGMYVKHMFAKDDPKKHSRYIFLATDQMNRGSSCISNESERLDLIQLNYDASMEAKACNGLDLVGLFLAKALELSKESDWQTAYDLMLKVFNLLVDYESSTKNSEKGLEHVGVILKHAKQQDDCIVAVASQARIHMMRAEYSASIKSCRKCLELCGEPLPMFSNFFTVRREFQQAKQLVKGKTDEELLDIPEMTDARKKKALEVLLTLSMCAWQHSPKLLDLSLLRFFKINMAHKSSRFLGIALSMMGALMTETSDIDTGVRLAKLGLKVENKKGADPTTILLAYGSCLHLSLPIASIAEALLHGYQRGLENGDTFYGGVCLTEYTSAYLDSGLRLQSLAADLERWAVQLKILKQDTFLAYSVPVLLLAKSLTGQSQRPDSITWAKVTTYFSGTVVLRNSHRIRLNLLQVQMYHGYLFGYQKDVEESFKQIRALPRKYQLEPMHFHCGFMKALEGLVCFWLFSRTRRWRYHHIAFKAIQWLRKHSNLNFAPLRMLLEAQKESLVKPVDVTKVQKLYDEVIVVFARAGLVHLGAIGLENAGDFLNSVGDQESSQRYYRQAAELYQEWGAMKKVQQLVERYGVRVEEIKEAGGTLRGQERYSTIETMNQPKKDFIG